MASYEILNSKQIKQITKVLREQWGIEDKPDYAFLQKENDIFAITRDVEKINLTEVKVNSLGLYIGELRHEQLRLSIEGSQLFGKLADKNVIALDEEQIQQWLKGNDLPAEGMESRGYAIIKHNNDFFGCGRIKDGMLLNFVPKSRRRAT